MKEKTHCTYAPRGRVVFLNSDFQTLGEVRDHFRCNVAATEVIVDNPRREGIRPSDIEVPAVGKTSRKELKVLRRHIRLGKRCRSRVLRGCNVCAHLESWRGGGGGARCTVRRCSRVGCRLCKVCATGRRESYPGSKVKTRRLHRRSVEHLSKEHSDTKERGAGDVSAERRGEIRVALAPVDRPPRPIERSCTAEVRDFINELGEVDTMLPKEEGSRVSRHDIDEAGEEASEANDISEVVHPRQLLDRGEVHFKRLGG